MTGGSGGVSDDDFAAEWERDADGLWRRRAARVLLVAGDGPDPRLLLVRGHDADQVERSWWFTVGGGIAPGEEPAEAASRELAEETGLRVPAADLVGPVLSRSAVFDFFARTCRQDELLYLARLPGVSEVSRDGWTELEGRTLDELRWWGLDDLAAAEAAGEEVYPRGLAGLVREVLAEVAAGGWSGVTRAIG